MQSGVGLAQLAGACLDTRVLAKMAAPALAHFSDPSFHARRRVRIAHAERADAFDQRQLGDVLGERAGVEKRNGSAHRVADQPNARRAEGPRHAVKIEYVIGEMIIAAGAHPAAVAMAAAVGCDDPRSIAVFFFQRRHEGAPAMREIEITMNEYERFARRLAPFEAMNRQSLGIDEGFARFGHAVTNDRGALRRSRSARWTIRRLGSPSRRDCKSK